MHYAGHARVYCCFDVLVRVLRHLGYSVTYVRNFTDIDDKIIARGREAGEDPLALARRHGPCPAPCSQCLHICPGLCQYSVQQARSDSCSSYITSTVLCLGAT